MSSAVVALPKISAGARVACVGAVTALSILGGMLTPASAEAATTTVVGQGTYENDSPAVTLNGTWSTSSSVRDSGGTSSSLSTAGYAEISFTTSGIRWLTRFNGYSGIADVYLDGVKKTSVDLYSATTTVQQVAFEVKGLPETTHTLRIVRTGTKNPSSSSPNIILDAFVAPDVKPPATPTGLKGVIVGQDVNLTWNANPETDIKAYRVYRREGTSTTRTLVGTTTSGVRSLTDAARVPGVKYTYDLLAADTSDNLSGYSAAATVTLPLAAQPAGVYQNDDPAVTLNGAWSQVSSSMDSAGSYASLNTAGYAEISFKTSGIRWITRLNSYSGIADVYLDGVKKASVDLYASTTKYQQLAYEVKGLPEVAHTLRIVKTSAKNASSSGTSMILDSFVAPDIYAPSAPANLVAAPKTGSVQLGWNPSPESDVVGYRLYRTALTGPTASSTAAAVAVTSSPVPSVTYVDDGLLPGAAYRYQVAAVDAMGNESAKSATVDATVVMKAMPAGSYEDDDTASITLRGTWSRTASTGSGTDSGGSFSTLNVDGYAELSFATSGIRWLARTNSSSGQADVYIDGVKKTTVDLYSTTTRYAQNVFEIGGLSETGHTIRIVRTGNKNASSVGRNIVLDAFVAPDVYAPTAPTGATTSAVRTGATVTWTKSPETDVASYRVLRRAAGSTADVLVGTTSASTTSFTDVGLADATAFTYTVVARDQSDNDSPASAPTTYTTPAEALGGNLRYATCPTTATKTVTDRTTLLAALSGARSGDVIRLAPGTYPGLYTITTVADPTRPLWICGPRTAVFDYGDHTTGANIKFSGAANVVLAGVTVRNAQKGISVNTSSRITIADNRVENIGEEAIHLKNQTTDSTVVGNSIANTGLLTPKYGEGVYIGTSDSNWCAYNNCLPDASDRNSVIGNDIRDTTAESIDAKNGTEDGIIAKNTLNGVGMDGTLSDSLVSVMGNGWVVAKNTMANAPQDGIQIWEPTGYGKNNVAYANNATANIPGYNTRLPFNELGNVVGCDSPSTGAALGLSNKTCQN